MNFAQRVSLLWQRFSPLEKRLLAAVREVLPSSAIAVYDAQVAAITLVQRHPLWTEIAFYRRRFGRVDWSGIPMFPRHGEFPLAEVRFLVDGRPYQATLRSIAGHIFDFAVTPSPEKVAFAEWDAAPKSRLLSDPEAVGAARPPEPIPLVWSEFMGQVETAAQDWKIYDGDTAYRVTLDEGVFLILAERDGNEFILHRIEPAATTLFHLSSHDGKPAPLDRPIDEVVPTSRRGNGA